MRAHRNRRRRLAALAVSAGASVALLAGAGQASASTVKCESPGFGSGDSLQSIAQVEVWLTKAGWGEHSSCEEKPSSSTVTYSHTSDGQALEEFGDNNGTLHPEEDKVAYESKTGAKDGAGQVLDWFVGVDDPPTTAQLEEAEAAAGASKLVQITIPVAQAPIAVLLSLPTGCLIPTGSQIDLPNKTIGQLWEGTDKASGENPGGIQEQGGYATGTWGAFLTQLGYAKTATDPPTEAGTFYDNGSSSGCKQAIKPQVSANVTGTAYAFKNYLSQVNSSVWGEYADDGKNWPSSAVVESDPLSKGSGSQLNDSNGHLSENTAANPGSVGYANVASPMQAGHGGFTDAAANSTFGTGTEGKSASHEILWAEIQNNGTEIKGATYTDPLEPASKIANCEDGKLIHYDNGFPLSWTESWHGIVATDPNIATDAGPTDYPICALTYDLAWHHYSDTNLFGATETAHDIANTVKDMFEYITEQGQVEIQGDGYMRIPTGFTAHVKKEVEAIEY
jgi:hypothetical protein